jgi:fibronectin type 3 domain-containing protein
MKKVRSSGKKVAIFLVAALVGLLAYSAVPSRGAHAACATPSTDYGSATQSVTIPSTATYKVWSRIMAPDTTSNSYLLEIDGTCYTVGDSNIPANTWTWIDYKDGSTGTKIAINLNSGAHSIKMIGREPNVQLDRLLFVSDQSCLPTGLGNNCATAVDATPPVVDMTTPVANTTVSGTVGLAADASDSGGITKVEFYINNILKSTDTSSPYTYNWDTKTGNDGVYTLSAKAYDNANNVATDTVQVTVKNTDSQAPTTPTSLAATVAAYNKVNLTWKQSTDNVAVTKYRIWRDGAVIAQTDPAAAYSDVTTLPNTSYVYKVTALDAAGNESTASNQATVTTPTIPDSQAPTAPSSLAAAVVSSTQINLTWKPSTDNVAVAAYDVYRSTGANSASKIVTVTATSFGDTGLTSATAYAYYVVARDAAGNTSPHATPVSATTQTAPTKPKGKGGVHGKVTNDRRKALANTTITLRVNDEKRIFSTNSSGSYTIADLPVGTYNIKYMHSGYSSQVESIRIQDGVSRTKNVRLHFR